MTNLSAGLMRGVHEARRVQSASGTTLVLSDGHANHGLTDPALLAEIATGAFSAGVGASTIGIGLGYDEDLLSEISRGDRGGRPTSLSMAMRLARLASAVEDLLERSVQAASLIVRPGDAVSQVRLLNDLSTSQIEGGFMVELGSFTSGEARPGGESTVWSQQVICCSGDETGRGEIFR